MTLLLGDDRPRLREGREKKVIRPWKDFEHTGPGTLAGTYLRQFWQPIYRSQDLAPGRAVPVQLMSERFTLYRGEGGAAHLVAFRCAHRGTQLSTGWVEGDDIRCLYHGWKYDACGQCVEQPGGDESFAAKVRIRSYPTEEYLGLVFVYLGEGTAPPFRRHPDFDVPGVLETCQPEFWPCNYFNRIDNGCDGAHVPFTHREAIRRTNQAFRLEPEHERTAEETEYGVLSTSTAAGRPPGYHYFLMPNLSQARVNIRMEGSLQDAKKFWADRVSWRLPLDDDNTVSFSVDLLPLTGDEADAYRARRRETEDLAGTFYPPALGDGILAGKLQEAQLDSRLSSATLFSVEDYVTQVGQGLVDRSRDRLGRVDTAIILLRKLWERELKALAKREPLKQWTIPPEGLANLSGVAPGKQIRSTLANPRGNGSAKS